MAVNTSYLDQPLGHFLDGLASRSPAPGGGAAAATAVAMAAGLVGMAARFSGEGMEGAADQAARADALRERAAPLAGRDAEAYGQVVAAYRLPREPDPEARRERIRETLRAAAEVPAEVAEVAAEVADAAARLLREGNPNLAGDAVTGLLLAEASARSAARLVRFNVESGDLDSDLDRNLAERADRCVRAAAECVQQAGARPV